MKKALAILALIAACGALCAPVWTRSGADEKAPAQSTITESFHPTAAVSEENKDTVDGQGDAVCAVTEPTATVNEAAPQTAAPEPPQETPQETPPPTPRPTEASAPIKPADTTVQSGAYVPGFGWVESNGENTAVRDEDIYENGNKIGSMG